MSWKLQHFDKEYAINHETTIPCVLIPGWSVSSDIFEWLIPALAQDFKVYLADITDYKSFDSVDDMVSSLAETLKETLQQPAWVIGWSMGGNTALKLADEFSKQVAGLVLLSTNLSFVERDHWPSAMPKAVFENFCTGFEKNPKKTLQRFDLLQSKGDDEQTNLLASIKGYREQQELMADDALVHGLVLLGEFDLTDVLSRIKQPTLFCFGKEDALVPVTAAEAIADLAPKIHVYEFEGTAHLPFLTQTDSLFQAFDKLLEEQTVRQAKRKVAASFSKAAASYDQSSEVQQLVAQAMVSRMPDNLGVCLDAGCGTGVWTEALSQKADTVIGLDMAEGMLQYGRSHHNAVDVWLGGDLEQLPLADGSVDTVFSSLAVQWCETFANLLNEWYRALKPGGTAYIATLGPKTLYELRDSFGKADDYEHVNRFLAADTLCEQIGETGFTIDFFQTENKVMRYETMRGLLKDLKNIGAHTVVKGGVSGLMGRQRFLKAEKAYRSFEDPAGMLPATYEVIYLTLKK